jgi:NADPH-dependent 2,4-dienoyl-CoA reductase/sulfur reductase-like enzyme
MHHVIVGAGPAGIIAADTLRKLDPNAQITVFGDESEPPYSRMALPYYLIDHIDEKGTYLRKGSAYFDRKNIAVHQKKVSIVDTANKTITLDDGDQMSFDKLLIATGAHPVVPPIPGVDAAGVSSCWTLEDARQIIERAQFGARVILMGAGFIACIIMEALVSRGVKLTVIEMENRMVPRMMGETSGNLIKSWCESKGVKVLTSNRVEAIEVGHADRPLVVHLHKGNALPADLVISATGVKSNIGFLKGSGIKTDDGVLVDRQLQTSVSDVYAAGDVAQGMDFSTGDYVVQAIQPTAADHGRIAGSNMAGRNVVHQGSVNMNVLDTMGLVSSSFGLWMGVDSGESAELLDADRYRYLNLQFQEDVLVGASSLGLTEHVGVLRGLIQSKIRLGGWKQKLLQDPTRIMEAYLVRTQAIGYNAWVSSRA